jgi:hypothetical protein
MKGAELGSLISRCEERQSDVWRHGHLTNAWWSLPGLEKNGKREWIFRPMNKREKETGMVGIVQEDWPEEGGKGKGQVTCDEQRQPIPYCTSSLSLFITICRHSHEKKIMERDRSRSQQIERWKGWPVNGSKWSHAGLKHFGSREWQARQKESCRIRRHLTKLVTNQSRWLINHSSVFVNWLVIQT